MTAMSLIVQPHAAYLVTDTAAYLEDGTVVSFGPKVRELHFSASVIERPAMMAIATTGILMPHHVTDVLASVGACSPQSVFEAMPEIIRGMSKGLALAHREPGVGKDMAVTLALAGYDPHDRKPFGFLIGNEASHLVEEGHMSAYTWTKMHEYVMRRVAGRFDGIDFSDPAQFDPLADAGELLDAQRADPFGEDERHFTGVGGQGVLTEIGAGGIRYRLMRTWPDKVGERIAT